MTAIHPTALIDPAAELGAGVEIGPYAVIGPDVMLGDGTTVGPHAVVERRTSIGPNCRIAAGAVLGGPPQNRHDAGADTWLEVGEETEVREYATLNRATHATGSTRVGARCYIMAYAHVAHDCVLDDDVTLANAVQLGGHVRVGRSATLGGAAAVHQFVRIGAYAFVGGGSHVRQDVPPYVRASGDPLKLFGLNTVGLLRAGFSHEARRELKHAYRLLFNSDLTVSEAVGLLRREAPIAAEVERLVAFVEQSERGVPV